MDLPARSAQPSVIFSLESYRPYSPIASPGGFVAEDAL